jgi:lysyl-tRNA synthetase class 1
MNAKVRDNTADEFEKTVVEYSQINGGNVAAVPLNLLVQLGSIVNFDIDLLVTLFEKIGTPFTADEISVRLDKARNWLEECAPDKRVQLLHEPNTAYYSALSDSEKTEIAALHAYLSGTGYTPDELQTELYEIVKRGGDTDKNIIKKKQAQFFKNVYQLIIGADAGPRMYLFLFAVERDKYLQLLKF